MNDKSDQAKQTDAGRVQIQAEKARSQRTVLVFSMTRESQIDDLVE